MAMYLVDYENVNKQGLLGIEALSKNDKVVIFYSNQNMNFNIDEYVRSKAKIKFLKVESGKLNALDFQLIGYLFHKLKKNHTYFIISNDKGFNYIVSLAKKYGAKVVCKCTIGDMLAGDNNNNIERVYEDQEYKIKVNNHDKITNLSELYGIDVKKIENPDKTDVDILCSDKIDDSTKIALIIKKRTGIMPSQSMSDLIKNGIIICPGKSEFYTFCKSNLGETAGHSFYKQIRGDFEAMKEAICMKL